jgi:beta-glucanase (GH16 family)
MFLSFFLHKKNIVGLLSVMLLVSCSSDSGSDKVTTGTAPSNLVVSAVVVGASTQNPNGDGSGVVNFNISAVNATSYKITLGDGNTQDATNGSNTYTYTALGKYTYVVYVSAYNGSNVVSTSLTVTVNVSPAAIWSDEFNTDGAPNSSKWGYDLGAGGGWGNNESQYYTNRSDNVIVANGSLKIIAKKENYQGSSYTSARLLTKGKFSFKYGRVEIRAKLPSGGGTWPALWMLGNNISTVGWPNCGEIDITEYAGNRVNQITAALHYPGRFGGNPFMGNTTITNAETEFHVYSLDWRETYIKIYVDNQLFLSFDNNSSVPFNQDFFLIFNCAMGGSYGGAIDPNFVSSTFEIDYVRVYK